MKNINQLALEHQVYYNTATGKFMWRDTIRVLGIKGGDSAEQTRPDDSRYITMNNVEYSSDRLAWLYMTGYLPDTVEHIDGDITNNSWLNLELNNNKEKRK